MLEVFRTGRFPGTYIAKACSLYKSVKIVNFMRKMFADIH